MSSGISKDLISIGIPESLIVVINNPVDINEIKTKSMEQHSHPWFSDESQKVIIAVGRLIEAKGFDKLIQAFSRIVPEIPVRLLILGEGPLETSLKNLSKELGVSGYIDFMGYIENPYSYLAKSDLFALSSNWEGFVSVLLEAMALGIPVVANDCWTSPGEILKDGKIGVLATSNDPEVFAESILTALNEKQDVELLISRAAEFSTPTIAKQYIDLFSQITSGN